MSWNKEEAVQIGRMEEQLDNIAEDIKEHAPRLTSLETFANRTKGVLAFLSIVGSIIAVVLFTGCATAKTHCSYSDDGKLTRAWSRSTVVGKGDTEITVEACNGILFETHDTGLSDNAADLAKAAAEAAAKASAAGSLATAVSTLIGNP